MLSGSLKNRTSMKLWAITDSDDVKLVTGWDCGKDNPGYYWVPELGYSIMIGHSLFYTREEAVSELKDRLFTRIKEANNKLLGLG